MNEKLQRWLDGELAYDELPEELRREADRWQALLATRADPGPPPPWLEQRVMGGLPAPRPGWIRRAIQWITQPRTLRFRPVTVAAGALALLVLTLAFPEGPVPPSQPTAGPAVQAGTRTADGDVYVRFLYVAPEAGSVALAGDFNGWSDAGVQLQDPDGDGIWTGEVSLSPGLHKYMFVVDGEWVTDPQAERYVEDGFGNRNALIEVPVNGGAI